MMAFKGKVLDEALRLLEERLRLKRADPVRLVVCGGSALIALNLVSRSTNDVDVVAMVSENGELFSPVPFPEILADAVDEVATLLELQADWLTGQAVIRVDSFSLISLMACFTAPINQNMEPTSRFSLSAGEIRCSSRSSPQPIDWVSMWMTWSH